MPSTSPAVGKHLLVEFTGVSALADQDVIASALRAGAAASKATLLHLELHCFGEGLGITGVALLAESHISIHTWPEMEYAAIDIFMCGNANPQSALCAIEAALRPRDVSSTLILRGPSETSAS